MKKYKHNIDSEIAYTHLFSKKKTNLGGGLGRNGRHCNFHIYEFPHEWF